MEKQPRCYWFSLKH